MPRAVAKLKITYPTYNSPRKVVLGTGAVRCLPDSVDVNSAAFFVTGSSAAQEVLIKGLGKVGVDYHQLARIEKPPGEPNDAMVQQGADFLRSLPGRVVVGIGGGSVMDWCRLAWARAAGRLPESSSQLSEPVDVPGQVEFCLVPTTCATGAEASNVAVYSHCGRKQPVVADEFVPSQVILDARFLDAADVGQLENSLSDALSHAIESYLSIVPNELAKENAISALQLILAHHQQPPDACRSERLMQAGYLGGLAAAHCSVGVVHAFAHTVSRWGVRHGHANALGLRAGIRANSDTAVMQRLLERLGLADSDELVAKVAPIVERAIAAGDHAALAKDLRHDTARDEIVTMMLEDVCMRTNPCPMDRTAAAGFCDDVWQDMGSP